MPLSFFTMPTSPPPILLLESASCTELAFDVQQVRILPSGLLLRCNHGRAQNVGEILSVIVNL